MADATSTKRAEFATLEIGVFLYKLQLLFAFWTNVLRQSARAPRVFALKFLDPTIDYIDVRVHEDLARRADEDLARRSATGVWSYWILALVLFFGTT